jgi:CheY-like chemotaxis protein
VATIEETSGNGHEGEDGAVRALSDEAKGSVGALRAGGAQVEELLRTLASELRSPLAAAQGLVRIALRAAEQRADGKDDVVVGDLEHAYVGLSEAIELVTQQLDAAREEAQALGARAQEAERAVHALADAADGTSPAAVATDAAAAAAASCVLVADDHGLLGVFLQRLFGDEGYRVVVEPSADLVAAAVRRERPALAIVDADMPPHPRFHALEAIAALDDGARPPVIVLSGRDEQSVHDRALELGAAAVLLKPCDPDELLALALRLVDGDAAPTSG